MRLQDPVTILKGVGPALKEKLAQLGAETIEDLLYLFPRRYNDFSKITALEAIEPGQVTVKVTVEKVTARHVRRGLHITEAILADETSKIRAVWFNQSYRSESLQTSEPLYMSGTYDFQRDRFILQNPSVEKVKEFTKNTARIVPYYPLTEGLKPYQLRTLIEQLLPFIETIDESLPPQIVSSEGLMSLQEALRYIHFPPDAASLQKATERLAFEEVFELLLAAQVNKNEISALKGQAIAYQQAAAEEFLQALPFKLTNAQRQAAWQLLQDLAKARPMNRLLQGDVGSGKTVIAAFAAYMASTHHIQTALMAPTEVLATQHAETLANLLEPLGVQIGLLVGSTKKQDRLLLQEKLAQGDIAIVVGTHALLQDTVQFHNLGLAIIDEQHRFGVNQRATLLAKQHHMPHLLSMTATPIPRSLSLTLYGELDISTISELPPGRQPIQTELYSPLDRERLYQRIDAQIQKSQQVYIVCPLVNESDTLGVKSVEAEYQRLSKTIFRHRRIGLLHGKLSAKEKEVVMSAFKNGELDILLSTTVVEVGVNVPNATVMLIEGAERFGLSQLHQLRGRIGRGEAASFCFLVPTTANSATRRLEEVVRSNDGFYLAEADLRLRGPGEVYGRRQHGNFKFRIADISDAKLLSRIQKRVQIFTQTKPDLLQYPQLYKRVEMLRAQRTLN